ncbi:MAG: hypothetical protein AVDCRST_MAG67-631 [uncultured Solirubrobacteraceae bacterium]|uniref:Uncharacterized protein n=1 Tax=uncultured Solirubrobacteraceae bacterium TaxID=1162706 RepID=A0A6J4RML9_9ACTN|nr:MAG: hypothetical protein AVDCRST_MAG67-631 [uncultured Solirubrobacteraceae bacterium]
MAERLLRFLAIALSLIVACGFILFAVADIDRASDASRNRITGDPRAADPTPAGERERERRNGAVREAIDDANDVLLRPFAAVSANADSRWVRRGVPALLGLLVYGFLLGFASRYAKGRGSPLARPRYG